MSDVNIYEISKSMDSNMKSDFNEIFSIINDYFKKKYINKLQKGVTAHQTKISQNPPREIQLLNALRNYVSEDKSENLNNVINAVTILNTFNSIANEITVNEMSEKNSVNAAALGNEIDSSVRPDGVYDIDEKCMREMQSPSMPLQNIILILAAAGVI